MWTDFEQGKLRRTGGMFGVAISGKGFFAVQTPDGVQYTRIGTFARSNQGVLVNMLVQPVLDVGRAYRCTTFSQPLIDANGIIEGRDELLGIDKVLGVVR
mgnify:CR=1 FL=1